jgi:hypothetical protein
MPGFNSILTYEPVITTTNRQLELDAADSSSYGGSGSTWTDLEANANATITGATHTAGNQDGGGVGYFSFDGTNDSCNCPDVSGVTDFTQSTDYTIEAWFYPNSTQNNTSNSDNDLIEKWQGTTGYPYVIRWIRPDSSITAAIHNGSSSQNVSITGFTTDAWNHVAAVFDHTNDTLTGYRNGQQINQSSLTITGTIENSHDLWIARRGTSDVATQNWWTGRISTIRTYNRALSASDVDRNFQAERRFHGI